MKHVVEVHQLRKSFQDKVALAGIDFSIAAGSIFGFLGPSGSGKTTTINLLTGQVLPDSGELTVLGKAPSDWSSADFERTGMMSDMVGFYPKMTVYKNLELFARLHQVPSDRLDALLKELGLYDDRKKKAEDLSTGMRQRMLLIRAILNQPDLLFLDEPTSGMDPTLSQVVHDLLLELKEKGCTIFLTTHDMNEATKLCDQVVLLHEGKLIEQGAPYDIIARYSDEDAFVVRFKTGETRVVPRSETYKYLGPEVATLHSLEMDLEKVFVQLTKGGLSDDTL